MLVFGYYILKLIGFYPQTKNNRSCDVIKDVCILCHITIYIQSLVVVIFHNIYIDADYKFLYQDVCGFNAV